MYVDVDVLCVCVCECVRVCAWKQLFTRCFFGVFSKAQKRLEIALDTLADEEIERCFQECCAKVRMCVCICLCMCMCVYVSQIPIYRRLTALRSR